jgi:hypothetical protein
MIQIYVSQLEILQHSPEFKDFSSEVLDDISGDDNPTHSLMELSPS